jgi:hypothetical protein
MSSYATPDSDHTLAIGDRTCAFSVTEDGKFQDECLNQHCFLDLEDALNKIED